MTPTKTYRGKEKRKKVIGNIQEIKVSEKKGMYIPKNWELLKESRIEPFGNSGHVILAKEHLGKEVLIIKEVKKIK